MSTISLKILELNNIKRDIKKEASTYVGKTQEGFLLAINHIDKRINELKKQKKWLS